MKYMINMKQNNTSIKLKITLNISGLNSFIERQTCSQQRLELNFKKSKFKSI